MNQTLLLLLGGGAVLFWYLTKQAASIDGTPTTGQQPPAQPPTKPTPQPGNVDVTPPATTPKAPPSPPPQPTGLDLLYQELLKSSGDVVRTFSQFNWYLMTYGGQPDLPDYFTASGGQTDPNTPISLSQYWAIISPWLKANRGFSGLSAGAWYAPGYHPGYRRSAYLGPGGWLA